VAVVAQDNQVAHQVKTDHFQLLAVKLALAV
jgi:hypothetical protein